MLHTIDRRLRLHLPLQLPTHLYRQMLVIMERVNFGELP